MISFYLKFILFYFIVEYKICIYGGLFNSPTRPATNQIAILDTTSLVWSIPTLSNPNIPNLVFHTATQYGTAMLLAFGKFYSFFEKLTE